MSRLSYGVSMSLDGFVAGDNQGPDNPLGVGGELLHAWMRELEVWRAQAGQTGGGSNASTKVLKEEGENIGAIVMGRNMFGGGPGPWSSEQPWRGWWGENPPFHRPVYVLTHYEREPLAMDGGTTFTFVTGGIHAALDLAREAAGGQDVALFGGGSTAGEYLAAGLVDEVSIHLVPVILGAGVRLFDNPDLASTLRLEQVSAMEAPGVAHLKYRVTR